MTPTGRPRRIGLVVDHPLRDLHGIALLAHLLARQGHRAVLIPFYGQSFDLDLLHLDLLVLNYVRPANLRLIRAAQRHGVALAVLDTEGGLLPEDGPTSPRGMAEFLRRSGLDRDLALYMFWGDALRDQLVRTTALPAERAVVTGCPRFDLAHPPFSRAPDARKIVLVNTNFPVVNSAHASDGEVDERALRDVGFSEARIQEIIASNRAVMSDMIEAVAQVAAARPHLSFVLRPHPFERAEPYRERFADLDNVEIRREGSVLDILAQSACLLHVNCTTAIEATMCGVPPISLDFANRPEMLRLAALPSKISHRAASLAEALDLIDRAGSLGLPAAIDQVRPYFGPSDGRAAERAAAAIASASPRPGGKRRADPKSAFLSVAGSIMGSATIERIRQAARPARRSKALDECELRAILRRFAQDLGDVPAQVRRVRTRVGLPTLSLEVQQPVTD